MKQCLFCGKLVPALVCSCIFVQILSTNTVYQAEYVWTYQFECVSRIYRHIYIYTYIYDMRIYMTLYRFISLLTYPESSEKVYYLWTALVIEVTSGTGMRVTSQHVGLRLPLFAAWNWQQLQKSHVPRKYPCHHVIQQMLFLNWSNNSNTIGTRPTLCQSLALKLQFSSTSSTILRLRVFFPHRKSAERRCFCSDLVSLHVPNPSFKKKRKDEPEPEPFYIKKILKRINTLSESREN